MRYCVDILDAAEQSLEDDNLHGERRWERQAARALLNANRYVGSPSRQAWKRSDTPYWVNAVHNLAGHTLITQADPGTVRYRPGADAFVSNVFCGLTPQAEAEIRRAVAEMGRHRVALTHSFQTNVALKRLPPDLHDLIHWLPTPALPQVHWHHDPWKNKVLLWSARAIHFRLTGISRPAYIETVSGACQGIVELLDWIRACLIEDRELTFEVLSSEQNLHSQAAADAFVWGYPVFEATFRDVRPQVKIHPSLSWSGTQAVMARTKLAVNDPTSFGGPPIEIASFGIPIVGTDVGLFMVVDPERARWPAAPDEPETYTSGFPEFVGGGGVGAPRIDILDRWHRDEAEYRRVGAAYRAFVDRTYSYAAFVQHFDALPVFR